MPEERELEKQLKIAARTGKYVVGRREVQEGVKGSKLLVWSASANVPQKILDECKALSVPAIKFNGNPVELGHACGIPFRVSVIALKAAGDADLGAFTNSTDYIAMSQVALSRPAEQEVAEEEVKEEKKVVEAKRKKKEGPKAEAKPGESKRKAKKETAPESEEKTEEKAKKAAKPKAKKTTTTRKKKKAADEEEKDEETAE
jgi:large subunit ribosomal protein L30e